ncbi:N-acetylmannosamine-6-phosphate 2-epimerase [Limnospira platensis CENA597]|uniref:N-acetylmannosamine-6-phosphate 2-epimerase n=1 Tax=Limnospira platensis TaxID=118562 RepID=UPI003DA0CFF0
MLTLPSGLIVSCQAPVDSPLHDPEIIAAIAKTAVKRGAVGVRIDTPAHIAAVRQQVAQPIIGLWKRQFPGFSVYITPRFEEAAAIAQAGADIIAIDATLRNRPDGETVPSLIAQIHQKLAKPVMADIDTLAAAIAAVEAGADCVGTTLYGYTEATKHLSPPGFELLSQLVKQLDCPVICEGGISSPTFAKQAIALGANAIVVGTAITGIDYLVQGFQEAITNS